MNNTTVSVLRDISIGGYVVSVIFAIMSIIIFFKCQISVIIGELTGSTKKKQIKEMRAKNNFVKKEDSYQNLKKNQYVTTNLNLTEKIKHNEKARHNETTNYELLQPARCTEILPSEMIVKQKDIDSDSEATVVLTDMPDNFVMLKNIVIIHTGEIIECI